MRQTKNPLPAETRKEMVDLLNARLADIADLRSQAKQAHWNVRGPQFIALHELFDKISGVMDDYTDQIAERAAQLGGAVCGTVRMAAAGSSLKEYPSAITRGEDHVEALSRALADFSGKLTEAIEASDKAEDPDTTDLFTNTLKQVDLYLWFVEAHKG